MNLIDILILGIILLGALRGYQRGFLTSVVNFLSSIAGFLVATWEYAAVLRWVQQYLPLQRWLEPVIYRAILPSVESKASTLQQQALGNILGALPPEWRGIFAQANIPGVQMTQGIEQVTHRLAGMLTERILNLIAFGFVFYLVVLLIQVLAAIFLHPFGSWGGSFNRGGGLVLGGLSALIGLSILAGLSFPLLQLGVGGSFKTLVQNSYFFPYLGQIFHSLDQAFSAQLDQKLLDPLSLRKGVWF
ncbi:CvpA family protein [Desulfosporosinus sp. Sb-LF]|uniref:CvpA family protein n=1 Tax=Desulfosporosinus sp. Sb-LF TaxID=2560027 RepID=UPI00107F4DE4|nr:CvpA family protein [Desulfosporosinus sp. Sb-LF]TGE34009.1 CvpA family protein [Desulfosporosinus sp. Sb-LF]